MSAYSTERLKLIKDLESLTGRDESDVKAFDELALRIYLFQYQYNKIYQNYCNLLGRKPGTTRHPHEIPFLPISLYKTNDIKTGKYESEVVFSSSGTTGQQRSQHHVRDLKAYLQNTTHGFEKYYGHPKNYCFFAILPGYQERPDSSLIHMVQHFINMSPFSDSGFYLNREEDLKEVLEKNAEKNIPTVLFGVSFALLALSELKVNFSNLIVLETGGMKTSQLTLTKEEIITQLKNRWQLPAIHSEYGMTEMLSQAYSDDGQWFRTANTLRVLIGELQDPLAIQKTGKTGIIKVMDLANIDSCAFIETQDLGVARKDGAFRVLGRMDNAELRGCNLLLNDALEDPVR